MWSHLHWKSLIEAHSIIKPWKGQCGLFCKTLHLPTPVGVNQSKPHPKVCKLSWVVWLRPSEAISLQIMMTRIVLNSFYTCLLKLKCKLFELVYICWIFRSFSSFLHLLVTSNLAVQSAREEFNDMTFIQSYGLHQERYGLKMWLRFSSEMYSFLWSFAPFLWKNQHLSLIWIRRIWFDQKCHTAPHLSKS